MPNKPSRITVDSKNRLIVTDTFKRTVRSGVSHEAVVAASGGKKRLRNVVLDGRWSLTSDHDLKLNLTGSNSSYFGKIIILRGDIERQDGTGLVFRARRSNAISGMRTNTIELKGKWHADDNNRITFNVAKSKGRYDVLRFQGAWQLSKQNEVIYRYTKTVLRKGVKKEKQLVFKGYWQLRRGRIVYCFERSNNSFFAFKTALQSRSLKAAQGAIKYQIGIRYLKGKTYRQHKQVIAIYGKWKLGKDFSVGFEVAYSRGKRRQMRFLIEKFVAGGGTITVTLKDYSGKRLGLEVRFSKRVSRDAEFFIAFSRFDLESRITGGLRVKF